MNLTDYKKLKQCGLIGVFGSMNKSSCYVQSAGGSGNYVEKILYKEKDLLMDIIMGQLNSPIDFRNVIILFTCSNYGTNRFFDGILSDHCTYPVPVRNILKKHGVKFKNNVSLSDERYSQRSFCMLIVQDGIAYPCVKWGDPTSRFSFSDKQLWEVDESDGVTVEGKEIIMSGFFVHRFKR